MPGNDMQAVNATGARSAILAAVLGAALCAPVTAVAQALPDGDADQGGVIIVNGTRDPAANPNADPAAPLRVQRSANDRLTEEVRDTPRSITIIPREVIENVGATSFREVVRSTPGVTLGTGEGGNAFGDRIFIRGFEARNDVYIDGLRDPGVSSREIFAVEQIEVLRGPSGAFGGRGTTGGLVSIQSKRASFDGSFVRLDGGIGTDDFYRGTVDANLAAGPLAVRVNGLWQSANTPGRDVVYQDRSGGTIAAALRLTDRFTLSADYYHVRLNGLPDFGHPFDVTTQQPYAVERDNYYGVVGRDFLRNASDIATLRADWAPVDGLSIRAVGRWGKTDNSYIVGTPGAVCRFTRSATGACPASGATIPESQYTVGIGSQRRDSETETRIGLIEARADFATGPFSHTLVMGGEMGRDVVDAYRLNTAAFVEDANGNQTAVPSLIHNLLNPVPILSGVNAVTRDTSIGATRVSVDTAAAYLIDTIHWGPHWALTLGGRIDTYDIALFNPDASTAAGLQPQSLATTANLFNWQASLTYKPVEALTFYASYATSANPSGEQIDGNGVAYDGLAPQTVDLSPERNRSVEAGVKWEANPHLLLTAAVYRITKDGAREQVAPSIYANVGTLRAQGVELGVAGNLLPGVELFGTYSYNDATIVASSNAANVGRRFANVPRHSGSLMLTYRILPRVQIGGQVYAQDRIYGGATAAGTASVPGYARLDAVMRWRPTDMLELRANVLNVLDKTYYDAIYRSSSPFAYVAPGRSATLTASLRF